MKSFAALTACHVKHVTREVDTISCLVHAPAHTVTESAPVEEACRMLVDGDVPAVAVVDASSSLCGVITSTDLLRARDDWTAADAMSSPVSVRASAKIDAVAELMGRENAPVVVVTDPIGQALGIVTAREIARYLAARNAVARAG